MGGDAVFHELSGDLDSTAKARIPSCWGDRLGLLVYIYANHGSSTRPPTIGAEIHDSSCFFNGFTIHGFRKSQISALAAGGLCLPDLHWNLYWLFSPPFGQRLSVRSLFASK